MRTPRALALPEPIRGFLATPRLTAALATTGIGLSTLPFAVERLGGEPALIAATVTLLVLMAASFVARLPELEWRGLLPLSLLAFLGWAALSIFWTDHQWATLGGLLRLAATTLIGLYVALSRDTVQIIRATSDVLRFVLALSLVLEVFSGILIDTPIPLLGIGGRIAELGPISGLVVTRDQLGLLATIGAIGFVTEWRMRAVPRLTWIVSLALAAICILLTKAPVVYMEALLAAIAAAIIYGVRRLRPEARQYWQWGLLGAAAVGLAVAWLLRGPIIALFNAGGQLEYRLAVWRQLTVLIRFHPVEGWGWVGHWPQQLFPYVTVLNGADRVPGSALNAFFDVWLQLGVAGLVIFAGMLALAFSRSWLLAGRRRSTAYAWPALVLLALIVGSAAESSVLFDIGWLLFVVCCVKASQELSWRSAVGRAS